MRRVALARVKDNLSDYLNQAASEEIVITRHGRPAGVLVGFAGEDDWFDYRAETDPGFLRRIEEARASIQAGRGVGWEDVQAGSGTEAEFVASDKPKARRRRPRTKHDKV